VKLGAKWIIAAGIVLLFALSAAAQFGGRSRPSSASNFDFPEEGEFHFNRLEYSDGGRRGFGAVSRRGNAGSWAFQDWPDADNHLTVGIRRLTLIQIAEPRSAGLEDDAIYDYPWTYATQTNFMELSEDEVVKLRDYLDRGGFLMTDDMYDREGDSFVQYAKEVYPKQNIEPMSEQDPMMHVHYTIEDKDRTFIPGDRHIRGGQIQPDGIPRWEKLSDAKGHVVMAINTNTDMGDAWEFADDPWYPERMTTLAYHYGINYIIYSMTH
jgi:hypothetical protein